MNNDESKYAKDMKASVADRAIAIRNIALLTDPAGLAQESKRVERQKKVYANAEEALGKMFATEAGTTDRERSLYAQIKEDNAAAVPLMDKAIGLGLANNPAEAIKVLLQEARPKQAAWLSHLNELADFEDQLNAQATEEANVTYHMIQITTWAIVGFSL
ncbi:MCP four helix bundle domain-containing protein, partial [Robbsia andropogonis]|uniref:MCP four helix bundle domain-containing protein n=1 Tax=Robbsia andropogonis TaxID=28092 RepID=UPI00209DB833|nr:MCP four helix bundle domain-containing protein [Robbsia andropogonis]MCP1131526.1 MCP four helix bundle domain-containing protein [Robbsia andropogonis]